MVTNRRLRPARVGDASTALLRVVLWAFAVAFVGVSCSTSSGPRDQNWGSDIGRLDGAASTGGQGGGSSGGSDGQGGATGDGGSAGGVGDGGNSGASSGGNGGAAGATAASGGAGGGS